MILSIFGIKAARSFAVVFCNHVVNCGGALKGSMTYLAFGSGF